MGNEVHLPPMTHICRVGGEPQRTISSARSGAGANGGEIHIEDLPSSSSDMDYDDVVLRVEAGPTVSEANLSDGTAPDSGALTVTGNLFTDGGYGLVSLGADNIGSSNLRHAQCDDWHNDLFSEWKRRLF